ncbi:MAG: NAD-dependent epimerase/dehydratase family protein [Candidatus Levybacteria bacterium]|nr:NAD-dependent epimerase/dehydratase family protein [Candidatus Levybacteria bacterium]
MSRSSGINIVDRSSVFNAIEKSDSSIVLHMVAKSDIDTCELDREEDIERKEKIENLSLASSAWAINVEGTRNIVDTCNKTGKKIIYISTDFVFDGAKDFYFDGDRENPINWYGQTKFEGEKLVKAAMVPLAIFRIAYPYRASFIRNNFFRSIMKRLESRQQVSAVIDHHFTPTFIDDLALFINAFISNWQDGIFHVVGNGSLTPYDACIDIVDIFGYDKNLIFSTTRAEFFKNRAERPFNLIMKSDKLKKLDIEMNSFKEGLKIIKKQLSL